MRAKKFLTPQVVVMKENSFLKKIFTPVDLTHGKPWKSLLMYGAPIMLSYLLQQIYVLTDAIICGQVLTSDQVAGVNDTFPLTFIFLQFAFGCTTGFSVITAKCVGCGDEKGTRQSFAAQIYLGVIISVILTLISIFTLPWLLGLINVTPINKEVYDAAYEYCFVIFLGLITQMGYNMVCGILRAYGDSVTPLIFLAISTALNVTLDVLFLTAFKWGAKGAAAATVLTQALSLVGSFIYAVAKYKSLRLKKEDFMGAFKVSVAHLKQGIPLGLQFSILAVGIIVMQSVVVKFDLTENGTMINGTPAQNGFGAASKLINFLMSFYNGLGAAILGYNAQNYGKGNYDNVKKGTLQALVIMLVIYVICLIAGLLLSINGIYQYVFMSKDKISAQSITFGNAYVIIDFALYCILGFLIVVRSAVQGICKSAFVLGAGIAELVARILTCTFLPILINGGTINSAASLGSFCALCLGDPMAWALASLILLFPFIVNIIKKRY